MPNPDLHNLPRLERHFYRAFAVVHWNMNVLPATQGWLNDSFHHDFRELLLHACTRESLVCPAYCLMPDHLHFMWMGLSLNSEQLNGIKFLRTQLNRLLVGNRLDGREAALISRSGPRLRWKLQPQAHDHVLREEERKQNAFSRVCFYVLANPVRARLVEVEQQWPFSGATVPGYPELNPFQNGYWEMFWRIYYKLCERVPGISVEPKTVRSAVLSRPRPQSNGMS
jgi:REP element-mobilizing transposase RayT